MEEYEQYDGLGLAALVRQGEVCPEELLEAAIARIEAHDPLLNAVVTPMFDEARAAIRAGLPSGPFQGVPFLLKDLALAAVPGVQMRQGAVLFQDFIPEYEAEIVTRYRRAGLVFVGKTATPELGLAPTTESRLYGAPAIRGMWGVPLGAPQAGQRWRWPRGTSRRPMRVMVGGPFGFRPRGAASLGSNRPAPAPRRVLIAASGGPAWKASMR